MLSEARPRRLSCLLVPSPGACAGGSQLQHQHTHSPHSHRESTKANSTNPTATDCKVLTAPSPLLAKSPLTPCQDHLCRQGVPKAVTHEYQLLTPSDHPKVSASTTGQLVQI